MAFNRVYNLLSFILLWCLLYANLEWFYATFCVLKQMLGDIAILCQNIFFCFLFAFVVCFTVFLTRIIY